MAELVIPQKNWDRIRIKVLRKYNHLRDEDLHYQQGQESELIERLERMILRDRDYVIFMLRKMQINLETNLL